MKRRERGIAAFLILGILLAAFFQATLWTGAYDQIVRGAIVVALAGLLAQFSYHAGYVDGRSGRED